eukprot:TRINITY_DN8798_c0_g1_i2.p1 TRINITY_DN8798_c0_g1~~TRINITY_DN8798_c0_g1_i2.p1  ORF type:complete len:452 (+),score=140.11 TRINITY_DN8798_c0_g1_i2:359-1714(+)
MSDGAPRPRPLAYSRSDSGPSSDSDDLSPGPDFVGNRSAIAPDYIRRNRSITTLYDRPLSPPASPTSSSARKLSIFGRKSPLQTLRNKTSDSKLVKKLLNGSLVKEVRKGKIPNFDKIEILFEQAKSEICKREACEILCICAFPVEQIPGLRRRILAEGLLQTFLNLSTEGAITVFQEISQDELEGITEAPQIGRGAAANVFKLKWRGREVALKVFDSQGLVFDMDDIMREMTLLCMLESQYLMTCYGAGTIARQHGKDFFICMEYMPLGSLSSYLKEKGELPRDVRLRFAYGIVKGLKAIHGVHLIHRDLKSGNILIGEDFTCKITDFGNAKLSRREMTQNVGTPAWIAPEVFTLTEYTEKADIYSFGIILWEMLTGQSPFKDITSFAIPEAVIAGRRPEIPAKFQVEEDYIKLMKECWEGQASQRLSIHQVEIALTKILIEANLPPPIN